jgi:hypothetical protein
VFSPLLPPLISLSLSFIESHSLIVDHMAEDMTEEEDYHHNVSRRDLLFSPRMV